MTQKTLAKKVVVPTNQGTIPPKSGGDSSVDKKDEKSPPKEQNG